MSPSPAASCFIASLDWSDWRRRGRSCHSGSALADRCDAVNDVGALCWNELATTDVERAKSFFGELLDWEYETDDRGYVSIRNAGSLNGGIAVSAPLRVVRAASDATRLPTRRTRCVA